MHLFLLCLASTTWAASCRRSSLGTSCALLSSGCTAVASYCLCSSPTTAPAPSPSKSRPGFGSSPAQMWMPSQPSARHRHGDQASHHLPWRSTCTQAAPHSLYTITPGAAEQTPGNRFFPTPQRGFCMPQAGCSFAAFTAVVPAATAETASEDRPPTLPPLRSGLGGSPVESLATPLDPTGSSGMVY